MKRILIIAVTIVIIAGVMVSIVLSRRHKPEPQATAVNETLRQAQELLLAGELRQARELFIQAKDGVKEVAELKSIQKQIEDINIRLLFSPKKDACSIIYIVQPNDVLTRIARKFDTTVRLIKRANSLSSDMIRPGQELKVTTCPVSLVVDKSQNLLFLKRGNEVLKTYLVATGANNSTPVGTFSIVNKLTHPTWFRTGAVIPPDSPENILGTRWMGLDKKGYGIHGTIEPESLGKQVTLGCIRMRNDEVEELYDIVPVGVKVIIVD